MSIKDYPARLTTGYYRVRETWEDAPSQLGAFRLLANAMAKADANPGYFVFSNDGEAIYPEPESGIEEDAGAGKTDGGDSKEDEAPAPDGEDTGGTDSTGEKENETPAAADTETEENSGHTGEAGTGTEPESDTETSDAGQKEEEFPEAVEYDYDGNNDTIAYAKLGTLMNIRSGNSLEADPVAAYKKGTVVEILQLCAGNWLRIRCPESDMGFAYVSGQARYIYGIGKQIYKVAPKDNLWKIAEEQMGDGTRYPEIRELNGLTCNVIRVGMQLVLP